VVADSSHHPRLEARDAVADRVAHRLRQPIYHGLVRLPGCLGPMLVDMRIANVRRYHTGQWPGLYLFDGHLAVVPMPAIRILDDALCQVDGLGPPLVLRKTFLLKPLFNMNEAQVMVMVMVMVMVKGTT